LFDFGRKGLFLALDYWLLPGFTTYIPAINYRFAFLKVRVVALTGLPNAILQAFGAPLCLKSY
jgi:hypothetical protein